MAEETRAVRTVETGERKDRVLIVEDEDNARKGYEQLLQRWGYEVLGVASAEEALAKFSNFQPDTVIADVELPGMNGLDLLKPAGRRLEAKYRRSSLPEREAKSGRWRRSNRARSGTSKSR